MEPLDLHHTSYGEGPPFVILHGLLGSGANWHTLSRNVFSRRFGVYAVDLRNHGRSPHADRFDYRSMAVDLAAFFGTHNFATANLLGHSMGGKVAMLFALENPDLVERLVVVDVAPRAYPPIHRKLLDALRSVDLTRATSRADVDAQLAGAEPSPAVRQFVMKNLVYDRDSGRYDWQMNLEAIHRNYDRINEAIGNTWTFEGPVLVVRGEQSDYVLDDDVGAIHALFPRARVEAVEGAGHWVHAEAPNAFSRVVMEFLTEDD